ncbi:hypothetical protein [Natrarchaeobius chitinivorans]|uniref:hypothetical protein n=1 Tax=Natrarchaeobius chitinivorans TaxID=1679083 RepID=UPI000F535B06|nr:hypothetical protein [Natrarchaeobius chitinivorans]
MTASDSIDLSGPICEAARSEEHTVELTSTENGYIQVEIDGVPVFAGYGFSDERFTLPLDPYEFRREITREARELDVFPDL